MRALRWRPTHAGGRAAGVQRGAGLASPAPLAGVASMSSAETCAPARDDRRGVYADAQQVPATPAVRASRWRIRLGDSDRDETSYAVALCSRRRGRDRSEI